jgi:hypothetical protein
MHGGKNWVAIAALVPGRTKNQCRQRWQDVLNPSIAIEAGSRGKWKAVEDSKLRDAVQMHGGKDWNAIATLVPGRTKSQCKNRWHNSWIPTSIERLDGKVAGKQMKTASRRMQYKRTVARIGLQLSRWFRVERKNTVGTDGVITWILASTG